MKHCAHQSKPLMKCFQKVLASPSLIWFSIEVAANVCPMASIHMIKFYQAVIKRPWTCLNSGRTVTALPTNNYCAKQLKSFCVSFFFFFCWMWQVVEKITADAIQLCLNWDTGYFKILCFKGRQKRKQTKLNSGCSPALCIVPSLSQRNTRNSS